MSKVPIPETFPNLPSSIQKIQKIFATGNINITTLVDTLQEEPLLCANILKLVNSPYYGLTTKIVSIKNAVMLLGTTIIRGIIMATILKKSFPLNLSPYNISIEQFDKICILRTRFLKEWLKNEDLDLQMLSSAAFLMESGKIVISNEILKNQLSSNFIELTKEYPVLEAERILFDVDSYKITSLLFKQWQFDSGFTELISNIPNPTTKEQKILHVLSVTIGVKGILSEENIDLATKLLIDYEIGTDKFLKAVELTKNELQS